MAANDLFGEMTVQILNAASEFVEAADGLKAVDDFFEEMSIHNLEGCCGILRCWVGGLWCWSPQDFLVLSASVLLLGVKGRLLDDGEDGVEGRAPACVGPVDDDSNSVDDGLILLQS